MYDALIFDVDGTLWNPTSTCVKAWNKVLIDLGEKSKISQSDLQAVTGLPSVDCVRRLLPEVLKKHKDLVDRINKAEEIFIKKDGGDLYDGVPDAIINLSQKFNIYLISNCQSQYLLDFIEYSGLKSSLSGYDCNGMSNEPKHKMINAMVQKYQLQNPVYIGDTSYDQEACLKANVPFVHASYGFHSNLDEANSFQSLIEIIDYFNQQA